MAIEINLLPDNQKRQKPKLELPQIAPAYLLVGFLCVLIFFSLLTQVMVVSRRHAMSRLSRRWELLQPQKEEIERSKQEIMELNGKLALLKDLSEGGFLWSKKLSDLSDAITPGIWLTRLYVSERVINNPGTAPPGQPGSPGGATKPEQINLKYLELEGCTLAQGEEGTAWVGRFIRSLKANPGFFKDFSNIESRWIKRKQSEKVEVMSFKLSCRFQDVP